MGMGDEMWGNPSSTLWLRLVSILLKSSPAALLIPPTCDYSSTPNSTKGNNFRYHPFISNSTNNVSCLRKDENLPLEAFLFLLTYYTIEPISLTTALTNLSTVTAPLNIFWR